MRRAASITIAPHSRADSRLRSPDARGAIRAPGGDTADHRWRRVMLAIAAERDVRRRPGSAPRHCMPRCVRGTKGALERQTTRRWAKPRSAVPTMTWRAQRFDARWSVAMRRFAFATGLGGPSMSLRRAHHRSAPDLQRITACCSASGARKGPAPQRTSRNALSAHPAHAGRFGAGVSDARQGVRDRLDRHGHVEGIGV